MSSTTTSFTDLLASNVYPSTTAGAGSRGLADRISERTGSGVPKFKSIPPPSLPISPPPLSPSSYFAIPAGLSLAELLDSPVLLSSSNILPSPTTGTLPFQAFNWMTNISDNKQHTVKQEDKNYSDLAFQRQPKPPTVFQSQVREQKPWNYREPSAKQENLSSGNSAVKSERSSMQSYSPEISTIQTNNSQSNDGFQTDYNQTSQQSMNERRRSEDGYNWRKYGQKQVKGSENPRSYYKCTYPNCPTKKKVETSLDGQITEIVYKGNHNHPKPQSTRRSSSAAAAAAAVAAPRAIQLDSYWNKEIQEQSCASQGAGQMDSVTTPENSSISIGGDDLNHSSRKSNNRSVIEEFDEDEPNAKRWKSINESEGLSAPESRTVREPRVVVQTTSDIDILDDGYRWRKYGQKVVKGNPNPRSYYKCTHTGCGVRKHVERAANDMSSVITTYEGKHNHDVPAARGSGNHFINRNLPENTGNNAAAVAIRPSGMPHPITITPKINQIRGLRQQTTETQSPFTLETLQGRGSLGYSAGHGNSVGPYLNESQLTDNFFSKTKEEPRENMFFESLLY